VKSYLRAIETEYRGYRFRSRAEARWAVFFDTAGVGYRYEADGFQMGRRRYLPDFFLPHLQAWVEIKGPEPTDEERQKAWWLSQATRQTVYVFWGEMPYPRSWFEEGGGPPDGSWGNGLSALAFFGTPRSITTSDTFRETLLFDQCYWWTECPTCGFLGIEFEGRDQRLPCACDPSGNYGFNYSSRRLLGAYRAARSARFEPQGNRSWGRR
jgi:hypothetical protein